MHPTSSTDENTCSWSAPIAPPRGGAGRFAVDIRNETREARCGSAARLHRRYETILADRDAGGGQRAIGLTRRIDEHVCARLHHRAITGFEGHDGRVRRDRDDLLAVLVLERHAPRLVDRDDLGD